MSVRKLGERHSRLARHAMSQEHIQKNLGRNKNLVCIQGISSVSMEWLNVTASLLCPPKVIRAGLRPLSSKPCLLARPSFGQSFTTCGSGKCHGLSERDKSEISYSMDQSTSLDIQLQSGTLCRLQTLALPKLNLDTAARRWLMDCRCLDLYLSYAWSMASYIYK